MPVDFRRVEMVNWTALLGLLQSVYVRHTTRSWVVHVETLYGKHPGELFVLTKNLADRLAKSLMRAYLRGWRMERKLVRTEPVSDASFSARARKD